MRRGGGRPRRRTWLAAVLTLVLLTWFAGASAVGMRAADLPTTAASEFVARDAHREAAVFRQGGEPSQAMVEHGWVRGTYLRWAVSASLFTSMAPPPGVERKDLQDVRWWREAVVTGDVAQPSRYRVFSVTDTGIRLHGQDWGSNGLALEPAPVWLPADAHDGQRWTSRGIVAGVGAQGLLRYRMSSKVETPEQAGPAGDGCLAVTSTTRLTPQDASSTDAAKRWTERDLWCPARGIVESTGALGGMDYAVSTRDGRPAKPLPDNTAEKTVDSAGLPDWQHGTLDGVEGDDTFGPTPMLAAPEGSPVVTADGSVVFRSAVTTDLVSLLPLDSGKHWLHWWARPGGQILSLAAFGRTVVVTTSERTMMAYAPSGRRLWSVTLDDVALSRPVRLTDDLLAVASVRGGLSVRSAVDGHALWSRRVPHGISVPLAGNGSVLAALDNEQRLHVFDVRTGDELWSEDAELTAGLIAVGPDTTVVGGTRVDAYDNRTGDLRWRRANLRGIDDIRVRRDQLAVDTVAGVQMLDLDDGSRLWSIAGADDPQPVGDAWFAVTDRSVLALDDTGARVRSWDHTVRAKDRDIVVGPSRVWVFGLSPDDLNLTGEWVGPSG